jgi:hypothetical protein
MIDPLTIVARFSLSSGWDKFLVSAYYESIPLIPGEHEKTLGYTIPLSGSGEVGGNLVLKNGPSIRDLDTVYRFVLKRYEKYLILELEDLPKHLSTTRMGAKRLIEYRLEAGI